jgi:acetyltransferase
MHVEATPMKPPSNVLRYERHPLDPLFAPKNVALIGATEKPGSVGRTILWNLISSPFGGAVFPVNPNRSSVLGVKAYPTLAAVPDLLDVVVVCTPAPSVPGRHRRVRRARDPERDRHLGRAAGRGHRGHE